MGWHGDVCNLWSSTVAVQCQSSYTVFTLAQMQSPRITPNDFDKVIGKSRVAVRSCKMAFSGPVPNDEIIDCGTSSFSYTAGLDPKETKSDLKLAGAHQR